MTALQAFIVEDNQVIRENLAAALEELVPLQVVGQAEDVPSALGWLDSGHPCDVVIIDVFLREGSGIDLLRALAQREHRAERVVLTNYATPDIRRRCLELGASQVFDKSSDIEALVAYCAQLARPN
ncbi:response regulator [Caldimonas sp. KR1-144]|uniref:response regulator n=1 Tax=Caldimonas sp. KR1-144 TaxID=3400911 RepID=UPI003C0CAE36